MSRLKRTRSGQTAVEMLFVLGIVLTGVVIIVPLYTQSNSDSVMVAAVRDAAAHAAAYIDTGVVSNEPVYSPLNNIIETYTEYRSVGFRFVGVGVTFENESKVVITMKFTHDLSPDPVRDSDIARAVGEFLKGYLDGVRGFDLNAGRLYYGGRVVEFNVTVCETWEVIS